AIRFPKRSYYRQQAHFTSSRSRHTRFSRDWSSDVCSSDLLNKPLIDLLSVIHHFIEGIKSAGLDNRVQSNRSDIKITLSKILRATFGNYLSVILIVTRDKLILIFNVRFKLARSEERRVGKE